MKIVTKEEAVELARENKTVQTACWDCVFASCQDSEVSDLNQYCSTGRLESLKKSGAEILEVKSEQKNKRFRSVGNRICNLFRTKIWKEIKEESGANEKDLQKIAREEVKVQCTFVLYVSDDNEKTSPSRSEIKNRLNKIANTMKDMWDSKIPPTNIVIINNTWIKPYDFINYLRIEIDNLEFNPVWTMEYISKENEIIKSLSKPDAFGKCMDVVIKTDKSNSLYFALFFENVQVQKDYLDKINKSINEDMNRFLVLFPENENDGGLFIQKMAYKQFYGNRDGNFTEKLKKGAEEQECQNLIQPLKPILEIQ